MDRHDVGAVWRCDRGVQFVGPSQPRHRPITMAQCNPGHLRSHPVPLRLPRASFTDRPSTIEAVTIILPNDEWLIPNGWPHRGDGGQPLDEVGHAENPPAPPTGDPKFLPLPQPRSTHATTTNFSMPHPAPLPERHIVLATNLIYNCFAILPTVRPNVHHVFEVLDPVADS
jgi:hypothetical protein